MMDERFRRTIELVGEDAFAKLRNAKVAIIGLGGVGGSAAEALCRSGVGCMHIYDGDVVGMSNLNRQIVATASTIGKPKAMAMKERLLAILPDTDVMAHDFFVTEESVAGVTEEDFDVIIDAIDSMKDKIALIKAAHQRGSMILSATGAGNRLRADALCIVDLFETENDPVCRILRRDLRKAGIEKHIVAYSKEAPALKKMPPASMAFVPNAMGILLANEACSRLLED